MELIALSIGLLSYLFYIFWKISRELHILQLNSYMNQRYFIWIQKNFLKTITLKEFLPILIIPLLFFVAKPLFYLIWTALYIFLFLSKNIVPQKKPFIVTSRVKRILAFTIILFLASLLFVFSTIDHTNNLNIAIIFTILATINIFIFIVILFTNLMLMPLEKSISRWYYNDAKQQIKQMTNLTVIGITGSFGKTSTKFFLNELLTEKFNVLMTPESYNTPMGVTKVIRTTLRPIHDIFIVEMGAKQRGDIQELCELVHPQIGILTAIGEQHLETFKNIETIIHTKNELIASLPIDGIAFLNKDNTNIRHLPKSRVNKIINYGLETENLHYTAKNIQITATGSQFTIQTPAAQQIILHTKLLGKHNIYNILAASAVAAELGVSWEKIQYAIKRLEPVPHRLVLKKTPQNITIIDDAFNSNPVGAHMALEVLQAIEGNKKILVTPGMVELGAKEYELNKAWAEQAASFCDYIILVGIKQTQPLQDGLQAKNYPATQYYVAKDFNAANQYLQTIAHSGDVVLFENDLPDTYNE